MFAPNQVPDPWIAMGSLIVTVACYALNKRLHRAHPHVLLMPIIATPLVLIALALALQVSYGQYYTHTHWLVWLLGPTTVSFALPLPAVCTGGTCWAPVNGTSNATGAACARLSVPAKAKPPNTMKARFERDCFMRFLLGLALAGRSAIGPRMWNARWAAICQRGALTLAAPPSAACQHRARNGVSAQRSLDRARRQGERAPGRYRHGIDKQGSHHASNGAWAA